MGLERFALVIFLGLSLFLCCAKSYAGSSQIEKANYTRLCRTKSILTVNGQFPGPTLYAHHGDTVVVRVLNRADQNITLHWHGVKQPRNPWSDGPAYITQCPIKPGAEFTYKLVFSNEEGTVWWHAHSDWARATVHGAIVIYPKPGSSFPFFRPDEHLPVILGEWWKRDVNDVLTEMLQTGGAPNVSDAFTINGQPGDLYPCSKGGKIMSLIVIAVENGKRYLLHVVNAALNEELFFSIAGHPVTVVGVDGTYTKPFPTDYIMITPGQTMDLLLEANQCSSTAYYMAARAYSSSAAVPFDNTTATAVLEYAGSDSGSSRASPLFPGTLPAYNNTGALANADHPSDFPLTIDSHVVITVSINELPCPRDTCEGPNGTRIAASLNNISFVTPQVDILTAYYRRIGGVFATGFPSRPPLLFNFTADDLPLIEYNTSVEVVFQGTNLVAGLNHPMHLHGYSFYVKDTPLYNLVDPPMMNTFGVPRNGWAAVRFRALNPGVWFMHCHLERHMTWGMDAVFIVKNGESPEAQMLPPPPDMPPC
ncbi:unnamed protein product [Spirodela intermedia]|uniref:Laccase n=1 Tax=Spirodela intermedia TaxID=51605 RepID=A0A7I8IFR4_SPIIN|nr:unnamed protein product [Spirodela intermedia]CAA6656225.1 unnamed protein product [Spirodela intermedia]